MGWLHWHSYRSFWQLPQVILTTVGEIIHQPFINTKSISVRYASTDLTVDNDNIETYFPKKRPRTNQASQVCTSCPWCQHPPGSCCCLGHQGHVPHRRPHHPPCKQFRQARPWRRRRIHPCTFSCRGCIHYTILHCRGVIPLKWCSTSTEWIVETILETLVPLNIN